MLKEYNIAKPKIPGFKKYQNCSGIGHIKPNFFFFEYVYYSTVCDCILTCYRPQAISVHETAQVMHRTVTQAVVTASRKLGKKEQCKALFQVIGLLYSQGIFFFFF